MSLRWIAQGSDRAADLRLMTWGLAWDDTRDLRQLAWGLHRASAKELGRQVKKVRWATRSQGQRVVQPRTKAWALA